MPKHGSINLYVHGNQKARQDGQPRTATSTLTQLLNYESRCVTGPKHILFAGESVHQIIQPGNVTRWDSEGVNSTTANRDIDSKNQSCDNVESINQSAPSPQPFIRPAPLPSTAPSQEKRPKDGGDVGQHNETEDDDDEGDAQPSSGLSG